MLIKFLFLDYRPVESVEGFARQLVCPRKCRDNPLLLSDHPAEGDNMSLYGSVVRRDDGLFQMWYTVSYGKDGVALAYAQSDDGLTWQRPALDVVKVRGRKTHLVFTKGPHGTTVIYDAAETRPSWKYKMLTGAAPSSRICAFRSGDGIHWTAAAENPVTGSNPDCPMSLHRAADGHYVAYHRPAFGDRRVARSQSWDFLNWSKPEIVIDQEAGDPPQRQFYGMGAAAYGGYELGTLWIYSTDPANMDFYKMRGGHQFTELTYCRSGYAWHRAALGEPFIPHGKEGTWDWGLLQAASSPLFLADEVRFYYAGSRALHSQWRQWKGPPPRCGIGFAACKPDRFVSLTAGNRGTLLTRPFWTETPRFFVNAQVAKAGQVRLAVLDTDAKPIKGFGAADCLPVTGDQTMHEVTWRGRGDPAVLANRQIRLYVEAKHARLYSLASGTPEEARRYWEFRIPHYLDMETEKQRFG
jgi:hypothetical protein